MRLRLISALLACLLLTNCATIHRHPTVTKIVIAGAVASIAIPLIHTGSCKSSYNGVNYSGGGNINCPKWCDKDGCYYGPK